MAFIRGAALEPGVWAQAAPASKSAAAQDAVIESWSCVFIRTRARVGWSGFGLMQRQNDEANKLEDAGHKLHHDRREERPKDIKDSDVVDLKKQCGGRNNPQP